MLKLERVSHDYQTHVIVRDKNHFLTRSLLTALAIAVGIHLCIVILFHISPIKIRWTNTSFLPVQVEAEAPKTSFVASSIGSNQHHRNTFPLRKTNSPAIPQIPLYLPNRQIDYVNSNNNISNPFSDIEKRLYQPSFASTAPSKSLNPVSLIVTGPLASKRIINNGLADLFSSPLPQVSIEQRTIYSVLVNGRTGRVFWVEQKQKSEAKALERIAEKILKGLKFSEDSTSFAIPGEIELHFNLNSQNNVP